MCELLSKLNRLKRPRLLINAARIGAREYRRETHLDPHLAQPYPVHGRDILEHLIEIESDLDNKRLTAAAGYSATRHVSILIAMMGEARCLRSAPHS